MRPLSIELFAGCMTWSAGWLELGGYAVGFDIEHLPHHGPVPEGGDLVLQDVLTLHGSQFRDASLILASPPCQTYSYLAMPWSRSKTNNSQSAKALRRKWETEGPDNQLFDACFRLQREACAAAGRYIPMVVENVRGAQPWVGPAKWNYGSRYLWGDVPAIMPTDKDRKLTGEYLYGATLPAGTGSTSWFFGNTNHGTRAFSSGSMKRKAATATISKIPLPLSRHIARIYYPEEA